MLRNETILEDNLLVFYLHHHLSSNTIMEVMDLKDHLHIHELILYLFFEEGFGKGKIGLMEGNIRFY
jgi:hypothetical protein